MPRAHRRTLRLVAVLKAFVVACALLAAPQAFAAEKILAARVWPAQEYTRVTFESAHALRHHYFFVTRPQRLVIDLEGVALTPQLKGLPAKVGDRDPYIKMVRVAVNRPGVVRVVFDLRTEVKPSVFALAPAGGYRHRLVLDLYPAKPIDPLLALVQEPDPVREMAEAKAAAKSDAGKGGAKDEASKPGAKDDASKAVAKAEASKPTAKEDIAPRLKLDATAIAKAEVLPGAKPLVAKVEVVGASKPAVGAMTEAASEKSEGASEKKAGTREKEEANGKTLAASLQMPAIAKPVSTVAADERTEPRRVTASERSYVPKVERLVIVAIDAGHGGEDSGARGRHGTLEKNVTLAIARRVKARLDQEPDMRGVLVRDGDYFIPLAQRVEKARRVHADLFVSIHADAWVRQDARGSSVFALSERGATSAAARWLAKSENSSDVVGGVNLSGKDPVLKRTLLDLSQTATINDSLKLGKAVLNELGDVNPLHRGQVEQAGFAVLKAPDTPSILVETAFISNPKEERRLKDSAYQEKIAAAIVAGIKRYLAQNPPLARTRVAVN